MINEIKSFILGPAKQYISIEESEFHLPYIPGNDEKFEPPVYEYVGTPTERLDKAWKKLLFGAGSLATL
jgi:hypothetical protein